MTRSIATLSALLLAVAASSAQAQPQRTLQYVGPQAQPAIQPFVQPQPVVLPKFGFQSFNINGYGEKVTFVQCNGLASRLGLEPGDIITSLNGMPLNYHGAWNNALQQAMWQGGQVQLAIVDVRTGQLVYRNTFVGNVTPKYHNNNGPITHHRHSNVPVNNFVRNQHHAPNHFTP